jgi:F-type H+-transporting ATPase subunit b
MDNISKLGIDLPSIVFYLVNFGIIFFIIKKYISEPVTNLLDTRSKEITDNLESSEKLRIQLEKDRQLMNQKIKDHTNALNKELDLAKANLQKQEQVRLAEIQKLKGDILSKASKQLKKEKSELIDSVKKDITKITKTAFIELTGKNISDNEVLNSVQNAIDDSTKIN